MKKSKAAVPSGLIKGFVPSATKSHVTSVSGHGKSKPADMEFKMGGLEDLDENGVEIVDKKYPKYAKVKAEGKKVFPPVSNIQVSTADECLCQTLRRTNPWNISVNRQP